MYDFQAYDNLTTIQILILHNAYDNRYYAILL